MECYEYDYHQSLFRQQHNVFGPPLDNWKVVTKNSRHSHLQCDQCGKYKHGSEWASAISLPFIVFVVL